jgi:hypothetical protein
MLKLSHNTTFHELHLIIQQAFAFDNDDMYAFYTGVSYRNGKEFYSADPQIIESKGEAPQQYPDWEEIKAQ